MDRRRGGDGDEKLESESEESSEGKDSSSSLEGGGILRLDQRLVGMVRLVFRCVWIGGDSSLSSSEEDSLFEPCRSLLGGFGSRGTVVCLLVVRCGRTTTYTPSFRTSLNALQTASFQRCDSVVIPSEQTAQPSLAESS